MHDLKLNVYGPVEDDVYAALPIMIKNVRRGNTLLQLGNQFSLGRRGLEKFFDLRYEHISPEQRSDDKCLTIETHMHKNYILAGALRHIAAGGQVEVLKTLKANGENVQVSWSDTAQAWVVCSKNVALIAQNREHIATYKTDRFYFAREMAYVWFDKLDELEKEKVGTIDALKKDLNGMTMIGEYVGSDEH